MFIPGQKVICINDNFHRSIVEWADYIPVRGVTYTVHQIRPQAPCALTQQPGVGLQLVELPNPGCRVCFSAWRFEPVEDAATSARLETAVDEDAVADPLRASESELEPVVQ